jgi:ATP-dependent RNA helicase DeaD
MLKMGFEEEVERILGETPKERQIALFSATMPVEVQKIAKRYLRDPERIEVEHKTMTAPLIEQRFINLSEGQKLEVLTQIMELESAEGVLIFRRTKTGSAELAEKLEARGFAAVAMHGDMSQPLREAVIRRLRAGQVDIVVATDVAARGLDVEQITHVVNYDVPNDVEVYVHRIGRTGRAGRTGLATLFVTPRERKMLRDIERFTGKPIKPMKIPSRADVTAKRVAVFKDTIRKTPLQRGEGPRSGGEGRREMEADTGKTVRLSLNVGKKDGIRPADIVGSIANEAGVPGREIGPIEIQEDLTYVGIPENWVNIVLEKVGKKRFRGKALNPRVAPHREESFVRKPRSFDRPAPARPSRGFGSKGAPDARPARKPSNFERPGPAPRKASPFDKFNRGKAKKR